MTAYPHGALLGSPNIGNLPPIFTDGRDLEVVRKIADAAAAGAPEAWVRLRAIRKLVDHRWVQYGGVWRWHRHVIVLPDSGERVLHLGEAFWWALGFADGRKRGDEILAVKDEPVPEIISLKQVSKETTINPYTVQHSWRRGKFYRLWLKTRSAYVFAAQVRADLLMWAWKAGELNLEEIELVPGFVKDWMDLQTLLPPIPESGQEVEQVKRMWKPAIAVDQSPHDRRMEALTIAWTGEGWLEYQGRSGLNYLVGVPTARRKLVTRTLPEDGVLPYVLGVGDSYGYGNLVTYQQSAE